MRKGICMKLAPALIAILLLGLTYATYISPIITNAGIGCNQVNNTFMRCTDGLPVSIGFTITEPYAPYYGNFTATRIGTNITAPQTAFGGPCVVGSSQTNTCFVTIAPYSPLMGNTTLTQVVALMLTSSNFPQVHSYANFSFQIQYYLNSSDAAAVASYRGSLSALTPMVSYYGYVCANLAICNATVSDSLSTAQALLASAYGEFNVSNVPLAYLNTTLAKSAVIRANQTFLPFYARTKQIVSDVDDAFSDINKVQLSYDSNIGELQNCSYSGQTTAASYLNDRIQYALLVPVPSNLSQAQAYSAFASGLLQNSSTIIASCKKYSNYSPPFLGFSLGSFPNILGGGPVTDAVLLVLLALVLLYLRSRLKSRNELKRIRNADPGSSSYDTPQDADAEISKDGEYVDKVSKKPIREEY